MIQTVGSLEVGDSFKTRLTNAYGSVLQKLGNEEVRVEPFYQDGERKRKWIHGEISIQSIKGDN